MEKRRNSTMAALINVEPEPVKVSGILRDYSQILSDIIEFSIYDNKKILLPAARPKKIIFIFFVAQSTTKLCSGLAEVPTGLSAPRGAHRFD